MQICKKHWAMCREAVEGRGLTHLVKTGEEYMTNPSKLTAPSSPQDYDPLMTLTMMLYGWGIEKIGLGILAVDESKVNDESANNGHHCPMCMALAAFNHHNTQTGRCGDPKCPIQLTPGEAPWDRNIVGQAADKVLEHCKELGLITTQ